MTLRSVATSGGGSGITVGITTITGGTDTRFLFDNVGVLGESATFTTATMTTLTGTQTLTNKRVTKRTTTVASTLTSVTIDVSATDMHITTAQAGALQAKITAVSSLTV